MSATDRIRDKVDWAKRMKAPGGVTVSVDADEAEALCDLADAYRRLRWAQENMDLRARHAAMEVGDAALVRLDAEVRHD